MTLEEKKFRAQNNIRQALINFLVEQAADVMLSNENLAELYQTELNRANKLQAELANIDIIAPAYDDTPTGEDNNKVLD